MIWGPGKGSGVFGTGGHRGPGDPQGAAATEGAQETLHREKVTGGHRDPRAEQCGAAETTYSFELVEKDYELSSTGKCISIR